MTPIITKFSPSTGDIEIMTPIHYADPWEEHINYPKPAYEEKEDYNIFDLIRKNEELKKENHRLKSEVESLTEFKEEHDIMKHFIISNKLWERFLNFDEFIKWLRNGDSDE